MNHIINNKLVSVIRADNLKEAIFKAEACIEGGISLLEITYSFADAGKAIKILSSNKNISIGAGTILNIHQAQSALESGARFLVSPHTDRELIEFSVNNKIVSIAGASTSNEIVNAHNLGANLVKIFPANLIGGPGYIKALKKPLPFVEIFVTGGIDKSNIINYLNAGVSLIGVSSALFKGIENTQDKLIIRSRVNELLLLIKSIDNSKVN